MCFLVASFFLLFSVHGAFSTLDPINNVPHTFSDDKIKKVMLASLGFVSCFVHLGNQSFSFISAEAVFVCFVALVLFIYVFFFWVLLSLIVLLLCFSVTRRRRLAGIIQR